MTQAHSLVLVDGHRAVIDCCVFNMNNIGVFVGSGNNDVTISDSHFSASEHHDVLVGSWLQGAWPSTTAPSPRSWARTQLRGEAARVMPVHGDGE